MSLALNRHHKTRVKNKVKSYHNYYGLGEQSSPRKLGIIATTRCICSCMLCSGYKKLHGNGLGKYSVTDLKKLNDPDYDVARGFCA